jgi:hypothetical protein
MAVDQHHTETGLTPEELRRRFARGATIEDFAGSLPDGGRRLAELRALVDLDPEISAFATVGGELNVLAIVEGWCRDSQDGSAVLLRLVGDHPGIHVRFFPRGQHPDLMAAYRRGGRFDSIPVFVFLDGGFNEIGRYVERPDEVTTMHRWHREELARRDPELGPADAPPGRFAEPVRQRLRAAMDELRERDRAQANARIAAALEAIAARAVDRARPAAVVGEGDQPTTEPPTRDAETGDGEACPIEW